MDKKEKAIEPAFSADKELARVTGDFDAIGREISAHQKEVAFHQDKIKQLVDEQIRLQGEHRILTLMKESQQETK